MKTNRFRSTFILFLTICLTLTACQAATPAFTPTPAPIVVTDGLGRKVTLPSPAQRIVSLAPSNIEILFAIGAGAQVVGRDELTNYPPEASQLPSVGGSFGGYSQEAIVNLKPDLVLAAEINTADQVKALENLGLTVYFLANPKDLDGMYQNLMTIASLTGHEKETILLVDSLKKRVQVVTDKLTKATTRPTVFYELDATDPNAPYTSGPGTFLNLLIDMAGGKNIGGELSSSWAQLSVEQLIVADPDFIILGDSNYGATPEIVSARAGWSSLKAVTNKQIYPFNDDLVSRPGPRLVDGLEALAVLLHPDLFQK